MTTPPLGPVTPDTLRLRDALDRSAPLALLRQRLGESNARFDSLRSTLPAGLASHVRPGPVDADGWTLLAANPAVAAKLRQVEPRLHDALRGAGWPARVLRIKVGGK